VTETCQLSCAHVKRAILYKVYSCVSVHIWFLLSCMLTSCREWQFPVQEARVGPWGRGQGSYWRYSERMCAHLLCWEVMIHIGSGGYSRDEDSLIFPVSHKSLRAVLNLKLQEDFLVITCECFCSFCFTLVKSTLNPAWQNPCPSGSGSPKSNTKTHAKGETTFLFPTSCRFLHKLKVWLHV